LKGGEKGVFDLGQEVSGRLGRERKKSKRMTMIHYVGRGGKKLKKKERTLPTTRKKTMQQAPFNKGGCSGKDNFFKNLWRRKGQTQKAKSPRKEKLRGFSPKGKNEVNAQRKRGTTKTWIEKAKRGETLADRGTTKEGKHSKIFRE